MTPDSPYPATARSPSRENAVTATAAWPAEPAAAQTESGGPDPGGRVEMMAGWEG